MDLTKISTRLCPPKASLDEPNIRRKALQRPETPRTLQHCLHQLFHLGLLQLFHQDLLALYVKGVRPSGSWTQAT
jgi:hypothetical protein